MLSLSYDCLNASLICIMALNVVPFLKASFNSLEFALRGSFMKIFDIFEYIVIYCMKMFNVQSPYLLCIYIIKRKCKFLHNIIYTSFIHHKGRSNNETNKQQKRKEKLN